MFDLFNLRRIPAIAAAAAVHAPCRAVHPDFGATTSTRGEHMNPIVCGARSALHRGQHRARIAKGHVVRWGAK